jgi:hypothetical protein
MSRRSGGPTGKDGLLERIRAILMRVLGRRRFGYRPERHYMRGPSGRAPHPGSRTKADGGVERGAPGDGA